MSYYGIGDKYSHTLQRYAGMYAERRGTPEGTLQQWDPLWIIASASTSGGSDSHITIGLASSSPGSWPDPVIETGIELVDGKVTVKPGLILDPQTSTPATIEGTIYYDNYLDANVLKYYDGTTWQTLAAGAGAPSPHGAAHHTGQIFPAANQDLGTQYMDIGEIGTPANPGAAVRRIFLDSGTNELSVRTTGGSTVSLEAAGGADPDAIHDNVANEITAITPKTTLVAADEFVLEDSGAVFVKKAVTFGNIESSISLANLGTRTHASLSDAPADAHHVAFVLADFTTAFAAESLANLTTRTHASLSDAPTDAHHSESHVLSGSTHTATGLTVGWVISADGDATFSWKAPTVGTGTQWDLPVWDTTSSFGDSMISQNSAGTTATIGGAVVVTGQSVTVNAPANAIFIVNGTTGNDSSFIMKENAAFRASLFYDASENRLDLYNYQSAEFLHLFDAGGAEYTGDFVVTGDLTVSTIIAGVSDYDKFLVSDGGLLKFRTGTELASDIGAATVPLALTDLASYVQGSIIKGGATDWDTLALGTTNYVLKAGAAEPAWGQVAWGEIIGKPSTFDPDAHDLTSAYHTDSGLTTGHFLKATGTTTFAWAAHGLTASDVGAAPAFTKTQWTIPVFDTTTTLGDSMISQDSGGTLATVDGDLQVLGNDIKDSAGNVMISFDGAGEIDVLGTLDVAYSKTDVSFENEITINTLATSDGSYYTKVLEAIIKPVVNTGFRDQGYKIGFHSAILPNSAQTGTLDDIYGVWVQVGPLAPCGMTIDQLRGIFIHPYHVAGTINNYYGIYHEIPVQTATVTNSYGLYIRMPATYAASGNEMAGYFDGDGRIVKICDTTYALNVTGAVNTSTDVTIGGDLILSDTRILDAGVIEQRIGADPDRIVVHNVADYYGSDDGALKITLPDFPTGNVFVRLELDGWEYNDGTGDGRNFKIVVSGFRYAAADGWYASADFSYNVVITGNPTCFTEQVRFKQSGSPADTLYIIIGADADTTTSTIHVTLSRVEIFNSGASDVDWTTGWTMGLSTDTSALTQIRGTFAAYSRMVGGSYFENDGDAFIAGDLTAVGANLTGELDMTGAGAKIDLNPSGSGNIIDITPSAAMTGGANWYGIKIDGVALDPADAGSELRGLSMDFTGVDMTNNPSIYGFVVTLPAVYGTATERAGHFSGDGRTLIICDDSSALYAIGTVKFTGELDMTGALACIDLNPAGTGSKNIIDITPSATLVAGSTWRGVCVAAGALDPATGAACSIYAFEANLQGITAIDHDASLGAFRALGNENEDNFAFSVYPSEMVQNKRHWGFLSYLALGLSYTATYRGVHIDWDAVTRDANAPILEGVRVELPADYTDFGACFAGYFSGDGRTVTICDTTYALSVSGAMLLDGAITGVDSMVISGDLTAANIITAGNVDGVDVSDFKTAYDAHDGGDVETYHTNYYTDTDVEGVITAEIVDGQSIDNAIDALILTHKNIAAAHHKPPSNTIYGIAWDGVTDQAPTMNAVYDKIDAMDTLIAANTTVAEVENIIIAELVDGQSIDNAIDALISTHNVADTHIAHSGVSITAGTGLSGGGTIAADRTINCDITQYTNALAIAAVVAENPLTLTNALKIGGNSIEDSTGSEMIGFNGAGFIDFLAGQGTPADDDVLAWDVSAGKWIVQAQTGGGGGVTGSGTQWTLPVWDTASTIGDSMVSQDAAGTLATIAGDLIVSGGNIAIGTTIDATTPVKIVTTQNVVTKFYKDGWKYIEWRKTTGDTRSAYMGVDASENVVLASDSGGSGGGLVHIIATTCDVSGDLEVTGNDILAHLAIGSGNATWINCPFEGTSTTADDEVRYTGAVRPTVVGTGGRIFFSVPLPTSRGGKKLYINGTRVSLSAANSTNRVTSTRIKGMGDTTSTDLDTDPTSKQTVALHEDTSMGNVDVSGYDVVKILLYTALATAGQLMMQYVTVRYYYAA